MQPAFGSTMPAVEMATPVMVCACWASRTMAETLQAMPLPPYPFASVGMEPRVRNVPSAVATPYLMAVPPMSMQIYMDAPPFIYRMDRNEGKSHANA